jgi:hypothetical protein
MPYIYSIVKADYLQRTRSYGFLITLVVTVYMAYLFVPPNNANYTTLSTTGFKSVYNSAWVGYLSAMMTTVMLSFYGFLLVNGGIKKDIDTEVGLIIATTPISNFKYLLSKQLSNYLVLCTIASCTFVVSLCMFAFRGTGYPFILSNFVLPYLFFALPALLLVASMAVVAEVFLGKRSILQFIIYFFLCGIVMSTINVKTTDNPSGIFDPFGLSIMTNDIKNHINTVFHQHIEGVSFGFIFSAKKPYRTFTWNGLSWTSVFLLSRILWMGFAFMLVYLSSFFFHRFDFKQTILKKKNKKPAIEVQQNDGLQITPTGISRNLLPPLVTNYGIFPFIKTELLLLVRQGNKWLWILNAGLWISMMFAPLAIAIAYLLPILWFLQVTRWSELATKEKTNRLHYFTYASYKPLLRMLPAQIFAGVLLALALALPLIVRHAIAHNVYSIINIVNGAVLIVLLAVCMGILSGGKKLFEVAFFMLTYAVINKLQLADYMGSLPHLNSLFYIGVIAAINILLASTSFLTRSYQARHL